MAQSLSERFFDPLVKNDAVAGPVLLVARIFMSGAFLVFGIGSNALCCDDAGGILHYCDVPVPHPV